MTATMTDGSLVCPPRFGTPRTDRPTLGPQVGEIAARLGTPFMPWQQMVADIALELDEHGRLVYDEIDLTVPRQSGKTRLVMAKTVWRLTALARTHGPQRSMYTAQRRLDARKKLERDFADGLRNSRSFREVANSRARPKRPTEWRLSLNNGAEHIQLGSANYWQIDAPSRTGGHGDTLDDGTIDEAFAHETDEAEGAMRPAQATRRDAQLWVLSTAGDGRSFYLWRKVLAGREACDASQHGRVAYFEWSAPDDADPGDPDVWRACSPALGHTIDIAFLSGEWERAQRKGQEGIDLFRRAYLNQWPEIPVLSEEFGYTVLAAEDWEACRSPNSGLRDASGCSFALDVAPDRSSASFAVAGPSGLGGTHVEIVDHREGTAWCVPRAKSLLGKWGGSLAIAKGSPAWSLEDDLTNGGVELVAVEPAEHAQACGQLFDAIVERKVRHIGQPELDRAVAGADKRTSSGDAWQWSRRSSALDISPLVAVTLALWAQSQGTPEAEFFTI